MKKREKRRKKETRGAERVPHTHPHYFPEFPRLSPSLLSVYIFPFYRCLAKSKREEKTERKWLFRADGIMMFHKCRNCSFSWWVMENCVKDEWCSHLPFLSVRPLSSSSFSLHYIIISYEHYSLIFTVCSLLNSKFSSPSLYIQKICIN